MYSADYRFDYDHQTIGNALTLNADCFEWFNRIPENCTHAMVTDLPYGTKEYDIKQLNKRDNGDGGVWRIPPSFDGSVRSPLPRFTALSPKEIEDLKTFSGNG